MSDSNLEELLQSPYDNERNDGSDTIPWKLPVGAAIAGALAMASFIILSIVTAPTDETDLSTSSVVESAVVQATGFPPGYAAISSDVALRGDVIRTGSDGTTVFISSVVRGGADTATVSPAEVASWEVGTTDGEPGMRYQTAAKGALGGITVELSPVSDLEKATLIAILPGTIEGTEDRLTLPPDLPATVTEYRIATRDQMIIIEELVIGDGWGSMRWHLQGGISAKVEVLVTFDGVESPLSLIPSYNAEPSFGSRVRPLAPLWGFAGETRLVRDGEPLSGLNIATSITVEFIVSVVTEAGESVEIPIGSIE